MSDKEAVMVSVMGDKIEVYPQRMRENELYPVFYKGKYFYLSKRGTSISLLEKESIIERIVGKLTKGRVTTRL